jgi:hypothetical protein
VKRTAIVRDGVVVNVVVGSVPAAPRFDDIEVFDVTGTDVGPGWALVRGDGWERDGWVRPDLPAPDADELDAKAVELERGAAALRVLAAEVRQLAPDKRARATE